MEFRINGRKVKPGDLGKEVERQFQDKIAEAAKGQVVKAVGEVRCPVHGGAPQGISVFGPPKLNTQQRITAEYCCDAQRAAVEAMIRS